MNLVAEPGTCPNLAHDEGLDLISTVNPFNTDVEAQKARFLRRNSRHNCSFKTLLTWISPWPPRWVLQVKRLCLDMTLCLFPAWSMAWGALEEFKKLEKLPGLMAASVCMTFLMGMPLGPGTCNSRPTPLTMPWKRIQIRLQRAAAGCKRDTTDFWVWRG